MRVFYDYISANEFCIRLAESGFCVTLTRTQTGFIATWEDHRSPDEIETLRNQMLSPKIPEPISDYLKNQAAHTFLENVNNYPKNTASAVTELKKNNDASVPKKKIKPLVFDSFSELRPLVSKGTNIYDSPTDYLTRNTAFTSKNKHSNLVADSNRNQSAKKRRKDAEKKRVEKYFASIPLSELFFTPTAPTFHTNIKNEL